jgi:hypothetical protein
MGCGGSPDQGEKWLCWRLTSQESRSTVSSAAAHDSPPLRQLNEQAVNPTQGYWFTGILMIFFWIAYVTSCALL